MAALLLVGSDASLRINGHRIRSRSFFRQGLLLSAALHLSLLFVFLTLTNRGDEGLVRVYRDPGIVLPPLITELQPVPPAPPPSDAATRLNDEGQIDPVKETIKRPALPNPNEFSNLLNGTRPSARIPAGVDGGETGLLPAPRRDGPFGILEVDEPPVPIYSPDPVYPEIPREIGLTGRVVLKVLVGEDGNVRKVEVVSGSRLLTEAAQETLYRWRFRPARFQGRPVSVWLEVPVNFVM